MADLRYVSEADFVQQVPANMQGLLTDDGTTLSAESTILKPALLSAEQTVESYLASRYDLPLTDDGTKTGTVPQKVIETVYILAKYQLYGRRDAITQEVEVQYQSAVRWLRDVSMGKASLVLLDSDDDITSEGTAVIEVNDKKASVFKDEDFV